MPSTKKVQPLDEYLCQVAKGELPQVVMLHQNDTIRSVLRHRRLSAWFHTARSHLRKYCAVKSGRGMSSEREKVLITLEKLCVISSPLLATRSPKTHHLKLLLLRHRNVSPRPIRVTGLHCLDFYRCEQLLSLDNPGVDSDAQSVEAKGVAGSSGP